MKKYRNKAQSWLLLIGSILLFNSCGIYSLSGINTGLAQTVSVQFFENKAEIVNPQLSQIFTDALRQKFLRETTLAVVKEKGDIAISGFISRYSTTFLAVQQDQPSKSRLTIDVKVVYVNNLDETKSKELSLSQFADFSASDNFSSIENRLVEEINEKLLIDLFNKTLNDW